MSNSHLELRINGIPFCSYCGKNAKESLQYWMYYLDSGYHGMSLNQLEALARWGVVDTEDVITHEPFFAEIAEVRWIGGVMNR